MRTLFFAILLAVSLNASPALALSANIAASSSVPVGALQKGGVAAARCVTPTKSLSLGSRDTADSSDVAIVQAYLNAAGYLAVSPTGYYGTLTRAAVKKFQAAQGIEAIGIVGPKTRIAIQVASCADQPVPSLPAASSSVMLYEIDPASAKIGDTVSIVGSGFDAMNNTVLIDGLKAAGNLPVASTSTRECFAAGPGCGLRQAISFTVPSALAPNCDPRGICPMFMRLLTGGTYPLSVQSNGTTSNGMQITITGSSTMQPMEGQ